uniref:Prothymosin alpha-like n=1 Tax=Steinernema glaseri TaxID=37863 RepID=A0A1I7ZUS5_9BILA
MGALYSTGCGVDEMSWNQKTQATKKMREMNRGPETLTFFVFFIYAKRMPEQNEDDIMPGKKEDIEDLRPEEVEDEVVDEWRTSEEMEESVAQGR